MWPEILDVDGVAFKRSGPRRFMPHPIYEDWDDNGEGIGEPIGMAPGGWVVLYTGYVGSDHPFQQFYTSIVWPEDQTLTPEEIAARLEQATVFLRNTIAEAGDSQQEAPNALE